MTSTLVILAAGAGSRYGGLKQLAPIGPHGETLLEYAVFDALRAGFERIVLVVRPDKEVEFRERFKGSMDRGARIEYAHQTINDLPNGSRAPAGRSKPWGTGQAVLAAAEKIKEPFAVVNADDFYGAESYIVLADFLRQPHPRESALAVVGFPVATTLTDAGPVSRALCEVDREGRLKKIVELDSVWRQGGRVVYKDDDGNDHDLEADELVSMNMWGLTPDLFSELEDRFRGFLAQHRLKPEAEFLLPEVIQDVVQAGRLGVEVLQGKGEWCGMTFREDRERVAGVLSTLIEQGRYPEELWK